MVALRRSIMISQWFKDFSGKGENYIHPAACLRQSEIHGRGWFLKKPVPKGTVLFVYGGRPFAQSLPDLKRKPLLEQDLFYRSVIHLSGDFYLRVSGGSVRRPSKALLINHSCDPNLAVEGCLALKARKDIPAEQELCMDYGAIGNPEDERLIMEKCFCGKPSCRKRITSRDWRLPELQKKYGLNFAPALLNKIKRP